MHELLDWHNLFFFVFAMLGVVTFLLSAITGGQSGHGADHAIGHGGHGFEHDVHGHDLHGHEHGDHGHESGHDNLSSRMLSFIGLTRAPLSLVMTIFIFLFGVIGLISNTLFKLLIIVPPDIYFYVSLAAASLVGLILTGICARLIGKIIPNENQDIPTFQPIDLVGKIGEVMVFVDEKSGRVHVYDQFHDLQQINAKTSSGVIPSGKKVLIESYDPDADTYFVSESPIN